MQRSVLEHVCFVRAAVIVTLMTGGAQSQEAVIEVIGTRAESSLFIANSVAEGIRPLQQREFVLLFKHLQ